MTRVLSVALALTVIVCVVQARTLLELKADFASLKASERAAESAGRRMTNRGDEMRRTTDWLQALYEAPEGLRRPGGLCAGGKLDSEAIATWTYDTYLRHRFEGDTEDAARQRVVEAIRRTPEWKGAHPEAALRR